MAFPTARHERHRDAVSPCTHPEDGERPAAGVDAIVTADGDDLASGDDLQIVTSDGDDLELLASLATHAGRLAVVVA